MKQYLLPENIRAALLAYLMDRPYREVADGVQALLTLKEAPAPAPADPPKEA
jgi:hypothetical protein